MNLADRSKLAAAGGIGGLLSSFLISKSGLQPSISTPLAVVLTALCVFIVASLPARNGDEKKH
ncbi:hypothetical protein Mal48_16240 [Thalassoglobus polymorphus]|uniref:Uncharacterized protein n=1 Tax=Thalassoglobus polymorphus TaxID=2527994 RepID=A0A517QL65_9PLAN|nr:hypothetical protein Mal48_16240 [Thalassoglobus polymorphus]